MMQQGAEMYAEGSTRPPPADRVRPFVLPRARPLRRFTAPKGRT